MAFWVNYIIRTALILEASCRLCHPTLTSNLRPSKTCLGKSQLTLCRTTSSSGYESKRVISSSADRQTDTPTTDPPQPRLPQHGPPYPSESARSEAWPRPERAPAPRRGYRITRAERKQVLPKVLCRGVDEPVPWLADEPATAARPSTKAEMKLEPRRC